MYRLKREMDALGVTRISELQQKAPQVTGNRLVPYLQAAKIARYFNEEGGALGKMGLPRDNVFFSNDSSAIQNFESGYIKICSDGDPEINYDTYIVVEYRGTQCITESSEWSASDEPYFIISYIDTGGTYTTRRIGPLTADKTFLSEGIGVLFKFQRREFFLNVVVMENDAGSSEEATNKVAVGIAATATTVGTTVACFNPLAGGIVFAVGTILELFSGVISSLFGLGDDKVGESTQVLFAPGTEFVTPPVLGVTEKGVEYNNIVYIGSDSEGKYAIHFMIRVDEEGYIVKPVEA